VSRLFIENRNLKAYTISIDCLKGVKYFAGEILPCTSFASKLSRVHIVGETR
jgi:hypothetical protein